MFFPIECKSEKENQPLPWEQTVEAYLGPASVIGGLAAKRLTTHAEEALLREFARLPHRERECVDIPDLKAFRVNSVLGGYLVTTLDGMEPVASYGLGILPYVMPAYRGRGICSCLHAHHDLAHGQRKATSYSIDGFYARRRAHALHVQKALDAGCDVPDAVRAQYRNGEFRLELKEPYGPEEHNDWVRRERNAALQRDYARFTEGYPVRYAQLSHYLNGLRSRFAPTAPGGVAFAARLAATIDGEMRVTVTPALIIVQVEKNGLVHDILGARASDEAINDLKQRGILHESDDTLEVFTFRSATQIPDRGLHETIETLLHRGQESQSIEAYEIEGILDRAQAFDEALSALRGRQNEPDFGC